VERGQWIEDRGQRKGKMSFLRKQESRKQKSEAGNVTVALPCDKKNDKVIWRQDDKPRWIENIQWGK